LQCPGRQTAGKKFEYKMRYAVGLAKDAGCESWGKRSARSCGNNEIAYVNFMSLPEAAAAEAATLLK